MGYSPKVRLWTKIPAEVRKAVSEEDLLDRHLGLPAAGGMVQQDSPLYDSLTEEGGER